MEHIDPREKEKDTQCLVEHTQTGETLDINSPRYGAVEDALEPGIYRHYKSTPDDLRYYAVEKVVFDTENATPLVIYKPLYEAHTATTYARPLDMFTEEVAVGKGKIPRFRYLGKDI